MTGEALGYVLSTIFELKGVLDAYFTTVQMKKNRPGILLTVLVESAFKQEISQWLLLNTSTFGVRYSTAERVILTREFREEPTDLGMMRFKYGYMNRQLLKVTPEFDVMKQLASENQLTFYEVNQMMNEKAQYLFRKEAGYEE